MKLKIFLSVVMAMLIAISFSATAQERQEQKEGVARDGAVPRGSSTNSRPKSSRTTDNRNITDHRQDVEKAISRLEIARMWSIGANKRGGNIDAILNRGVHPNRTPQSFYNIKGNRNFLQRERQTLGINIGFTSSASAEVANKKSLWGFFPKNPGTLTRANINGLRKKPIVYGELIAIGWWFPISNGVNYSEFGLLAGKNVPYFLKSASRNVGPNLAFNRDGAHYEWVILGGEPGTAVNLGGDNKVVLFNIKKKKALGNAFLIGNGVAHIGLTNTSFANDYDTQDFLPLMLKPARDAMLK